MATLHQTSVSRNSKSVHTLYIISAPRKAVHTLGLDAMGGEHSLASPRALITSAFVTGHYTKEQAGFFCSGTTGSRARLAVGCMIFSCNLPSAPLATHSPCPWGHTVSGGVPWLYNAEKQ